MRKLLARERARGEFFALNFFLPHQAALSRAPLFWKLSTISNSTPPSLRKSRNPETLVTNRCFCFPPTHFASSWRARCSLCLIPTILQYPPQTQTRLYKGSLPPSHHRSIPPLPLNNPKLANSSLPLLHLYAIMNKTPPSLQRGDVKFQQTRSVRVYLTDLDRNLQIDQRNLKLDLQASLEQMQLRTTIQLDPVENGRQRELLLLLGKLPRLE